MLAEDAHCISGSSGRQRYTVHIQRAEGAEDVHIGRAEGDQDIQGGLRALRIYMKEGLRVLRTFSQGYGCSGLYIGRGCSGI